MSKQLAISATVSVLAMSVYVLFGADAAREPLGAPPISIQSPALPTPQVSLDARALLR